MNNYTSPNGLPHMINLKREREVQIKNLINNLKLSEVREDKDFQNTTARIKRTILLTPVVMGKPECIDHEYEQRSLSMSDQVRGLSREHYVHTVSFPFTGDEEVFSYIPEKGFSYSSNDHGLILPDGEEIIVYVDLPELNPQGAVTAAQNLLNLTLQFKDQNNASIKAWSTGVELTIDKLLQEKRQELIEKFGK